MPNNNILIAANFSNKTGYAWNNIYRLFDKIVAAFANENTSICVTFAELSPPIEQVQKRPSVSFAEWDPMDSSLSNTLKLSKIIKQKNIGYLYFTDLRYIDWRYAVFRLSGVKKIITHSRISVADPQPAPYEGGVKGLIKYLAGRVKPICADRVYAVSDFVRNRMLLKNRAPANKIIKILNGINLDAFTPSHPAPSDKLIIFTCGRATEHKGIHILMDALHFLRPLIPEDAIEVRYAGDGPNISQFQEKVNGLDISNIFTFLGELPNTRDEVKNAHILVVPSIWGDACPSSVSESLASGKPLIATKAGGIPEIIGSEQNAIIVPPGNHFALAIALLSLIKSPELRETLSVNARARAEDTLDQINYHRIVIDQLAVDFSLTPN